MQSAFAEFMPVKESHESKDATSAPRRDFLKLMGFSVAAATLASCETPVRKAIPYLNKPEEIDPAISNFYASTYFTGGDYNAVLVKTREGRPIKLEGNPESPITNGGLSARAQAAVLSLYDGGRLQNFAIKSANGYQKAEVPAFDRTVRTKLAATTGRIAIVSPTIISPTTKRAIAEFASRYPNTTHVMYDTQSVTGLLQANNGVVPGYDFSRANIIVSLEADFLGTWISPVEYGRQYAMTRKINREKRTMSRHYQFETAMTLTGSNADIRVPVKPSEMGQVALALYNAVTGAGGASAYKNDKLTQAARDLTANRGASLVVIYRAIERKQPIQWVRIHNLPDLAYFNHSQHTQVAGLQCQTCHGPIQNMEVVYQYSALTMGWCINCHREMPINAKDNDYYDRLVKLHDTKNAGAPFTVSSNGGTECSKCHY
jgi:molybdopterin-containing oxidoreductase family iron-sulfur binding subunit